MNFTNLTRIIFYSILASSILLPDLGYSQKIINSFEVQNDLLDIATSEGVKISRSTDFPALGAYSCKAIFPENGGSVFINNLESSFQKNIENSGVK